MYLCIWKKKMVLMLLKINKFSISFNHQKDRTFLGTNYKPCVLHRKAIMNKILLDVKGESISMIVSYLVMTSYVLE